MTRRGAVTLEQAMHESPVLGALAMRAHEAHTCLECIRPAVPAALFASLRAGPVDDKGEWVILVSQPAAAAKLRQLIPTLLTRLSDMPFVIRGVRVKVMKTPAEG
jgi:hypothetical protein